MTEVIQDWTTFNSIMHGKRGKKVASFTTPFIITYIKHNAIKSLEQLPNYSVSIKIWDVSPAPGQSRRPGFIRPRKNGSTSSVSDTSPSVLGRPRGQSANLPMLMRYPSAGRRTSPYRTPFPPRAGRDAVPTHVARPHPSPRDFPLLHSLITSFLLSSAFLFFFAPSMLSKIHI